MNLTHFFYHVHDSIFRMLRWGYCYDPPHAMHFQLRFPCFFSIFLSASLSSSTVPCVSFHQVDSCGHTSQLFLCVLLEKFFLTVFSICFFPRSFALILPHHKQTHTHTIYCGLFQYPKDAYTTNILCLEINELERKIQQTLTRACMYLMEMLRFEYRQQFEEKPNP